MKRKNRVVLGVAAVLGLLTAGTVWLLNAAVEVADDALDTTLSAARSVEKIMKDEPGPAAKTAGHQDRNEVADAARQADKEAKQTSTVATTTSDPSFVRKSGDGTDAAKDQVSKSDHKTDAPAKTDVLTAIEHNVGPLLDDDDSAGVNIAALTKAFSDNSSDDDWLALVPGGKSPTLKRLMAGKYAGKEDQAVEDAISDPQAWRLFSFLGGL
jgi:hypothetical protein